MSFELAVALLALLVALFAVVALVAVYARVRVLEAGRAAELSGYATLVGRPAPVAVRPRDGQARALVAVIDGDCTLCYGVWDALGAAAGRVDQRGRGTRFVALADRAGVFDAGSAELIVDPDTRAEMFEGYSPTLLVLDAAGTVTHRRFVYADTDVPALLQDLITEHQVTRA